MRGRVRFGEFVGAVEPLFWKRVATRRCRARLALRLRLGGRFTSGKTGKNADHGPGALAAGKRPVAFRTRGRRVHKLVRADGARQRGQGCGAPVGPDALSAQLDSVALRSEEHT